MSKKNFFLLGLFIFFSLSISLFVGLFLNEDASGIGTSNDFKNTLPYVEALKDRLIIDGSEWTRLLPLHFIFISFLFNLSDNVFLVRLIFCSISILVPYFFYLNLKLRFTSISDGKLLILSSTILLLPFFRSSAIWPNPHILSLIFVLISIYFFNKWEKNYLKKIDYTFLLHLVFLALAVYTRRYYVFFFIYYFIYYLKFFNFKKMIYAFLLISLFSIPGFLLIFKFPYYLTSSGYNFKYFNTFLIISSIFLFFIIPFLKPSNFQNLNENLLSKIVLAFLITVLSAIFFDYNPKNGGGIFMKISNIFLGGNIFFFLTSFVGFFIINKLVKENKYSLYLIIIVFILFSNNYMYQKYFEPLWLILFFLVINSKIFLNFLKSDKQIFLVLGYFVLYYVAAISNSLLKISLNYFW